MSYLLIRNHYKKLIRELFTWKCKNTFTDQVQTKEVHEAEVRNYLESDGKEDNLC